MLDHGDRIKQVRMTCHVLDLDIELAWQPEVIMREERDEFAPRPSDSFVVGVRDPRGGLPEDGDQLVAAGDLHRSIAGATVDDEDLAGLELRPKYAVERLCEIPCTVLDDDEDADRWQFTEPIHFGSRLLGLLYRPADLVDIMYRVEKQ